MQGSMNEAVSALYLECDKDFYNMEWSNTLIIVFDMLRSQHYAFPQITQPFVRRQTWARVITGLLWQFTEQDAAMINGLVIKDE